VVLLLAAEPEELRQAPTPVPAPAGVCPDSDDVLQGPTLWHAPPPAPIGPAELQPRDRPLPINLATALRLSDARPLVIAAAQAGVTIAAGQLQKANVLWLPNLNTGAAYIRHDGGNQNTNGSLITDSTNFFLAGAGLEFRFATTDAIYEPLAARQVLRARWADVQTAKNDALLATAEAYFTVQQARGTYAAMVDAVEKNRELVKRVESLARGLAPAVEVDRARTQLAELEQAAATARQQWRVASANLTRILRLDPAAVVVPLEPDHLQVTLIDPGQAVDCLIPIGLTFRPELAAHQALVQATLARLQQERLRPLIPSILITGNGTPDFLYNGGIFGTGHGSNLNEWAGRSDVSAQVVWKVENLGFGNLGRIKERRGQWQLALVELFHIQDTVAAEVTQAHAELEAAAVRVVQAETGLKEGLTSFEGNMKGLGQTTRFGDILYLVNRPQEVVAALQQLQLAYVNYFRTVADFNRAQFRLFHALGYPAHLLACERSPGPLVPVETGRPFPMPPVCAPQPCACYPAAPPVIHQPQAVPAAGDPSEPRPQQRSEAP
jgi:outer membrane protein TolC